MAGVFIRVVALLIIITGLPAAAHEINPTIADLTVVDGRAELLLRLNLEAHLAEIDLDTVSNTDDMADISQYAHLRALPPEELKGRFEEASSGFLNGVVLRVGTGQVDLRVKDLLVSDVGDVELPRLSGLRLVGALPPGADWVTFQWGEGYGPIVLRQQGVEAPFTGFLAGGETSPAIEVFGGGALSSGQTFLRYVPVGFAHILPKGLDHILFVLGLFFLSLRLRPLLWQISAFTLAHTVTLALGAMGLVTVPASVVEPLIAASIVYVAVENILSDGLSRWRPIVVFGFGLLHGLGFASVLGEFGLPQGQFIPALLGFNVGVELGQLCVIAGAFGIFGFWFGQKYWYRARIAVPASALIALVGAWWFVQRVFL